MFLSFYLEVQSSSLFFFECLEKLFLPKLEIFCHSVMKDENVTILFYFFLSYRDNCLLQKSSFIILVCRSECPTALSELAGLHFNWLNNACNRDVLSLWMRQGCFNEIHRRLGYRLIIRTVGNNKWVTIISHFLWNFLSLWSPI